MAIFISDQPFTKLVTTFIRELEMREESCESLIFKPEERMKTSLIRREKTSYKYRPVLF